MTMQAAGFSNGVTAQCFPLQYGKLNLTSGTYTGITMIHCVADGSLTILYPDSGTPVVVPCIENNEFSVANATSVTVTTGTFHLA